MWSAAGTVAGMVCPVSELTALARTYIPCLKPIPPPFHDDERFTDRLSDEDLKSLTNVTRALGLSYAEVQRYLRCFCCLDGLRLGKVSIRHISVHHSIKHTPFLDCVFSHLATPEGPPSDEVQSPSSSGPPLPEPRLIDATGFFIALWEFCSLSPSELLMFIFHCLGVHEPRDTPTPKRFLGRLIRLVHGSQPSTEIKQLLRCLRCLPESPQPPVIRRHASSDRAAACDGVDDADGSSTVDSKRNPVTTTVFAAARDRPISSDDVNDSPAERWCACCEILLRFPILVQPALSLQRTLRRKILGEVRCVHARVHRAAVLIHPHTMP